MIVPLVADIDGVRHLYRCARCRRPMATNGVDGRSVCPSCGPTFGVYVPADWGPVRLSLLKVPFAESRAGDAVTERDLRV